MPIAQQQAIEWAGPATADQLTALRSPRPDGRLTAKMSEYMVNVSSAVVYCIIAGGPHPPIFPVPGPASQIDQWCRSTLLRDERKRETLKGSQSTKTSLANKNAAQDPTFLRTFGHQADMRIHDPNIPFLRVS